MANEICEKIKNDEFFQHFLSDQKNDHQLNTTLTITDQINKLSSGLEAISTELQTQVRQQHGALLSQASHAGKLTAALDSVEGSVRQLQVGADRLKSQIPYTLLENQTNILIRLHETSNLLRQSGRFLAVHKRLEASSNLADQATLLYELENLLEDTELAKLEIIKDEKAAVMSARQKLLSKTNRDLDTALETSDNDEKIAECLQIFANLRVLTNFLDKTMLENFLNDIKHVLKECFAGADVAGLQKNSQKKATAKNVSERKGPGKTPTLTTSQHFRQKLWTALDWIFAEYIFGYCKLALRLSQCLAKVVENSGEKSEIATQFHTIFWSRLQNLLQVSLTNTAPVHIQQCFQQQLPKLLAAAKVLVQKLDHQFEFSENMFEALEVGYLEKCGSNLKAALLNVDHPEKENIDALMRAAALELSASIVDKRLCRLVVGAFKACNQDFWTKIESQVKIGTDSAQVYDVANAAQIQNTNLCNLIFYHAECVGRMVDNVGAGFATSESAENILGHLSTGQNLVMVVLQQLFDSITSAVNIILLTMHREPGLDGNSSGNNSNHDLSLYMRELQDFLNRSWSSHINAFGDKGAVEKCSRELAIRCIELFVQNVCILRPLSATGRERIKNDCLRLETALRPVNVDLSTLGKCYRMLRALASLVTETPETLVAQTNEKGGAIPHYCVLLLLFGHATSADLLSPHTAAGWNNDKLIQWLGGHTSDTERFELVEGALQRYRTTIRQKKMAKYDPVYPLISNLLDTAKEQIG